MSTDSAIPHKYVVVDVCIKILRLSHDGNDLTPFELRAVEAGVNGRLNEKGERYLRNLLDDLLRPESPLTG